MEKHNYIQIINVFNGFNLEQDSKISKSQIYSILNRIVLKYRDRMQETSDNNYMYHSRLFHQEFNLDLAQQLWSNTHNNQQQEQQEQFKYIKNFTITLCQAIQLLQYNLSQIIDVIIFTIQQQTNLINDPSTNGQFCQLLKSSQSFLSDYTLLIESFNINISAQLTDKIYLYQKIVRRICEMDKRKKLRILFKRIYDLQKSQLHFQHKDDAQKSIGLKIVLWASMMMLGLEMILMFQKHHFYQLMVISLVLGIFFLNLFDSIYIRFVIGNLSLSIFFDTFWLYQMGEKYWNPPKNTIHSHLQNSFLKFVVLFIAFAIILKTLQIYLLFQYWNSPEGYIQYVDFISLRFKLTSNSSTNQITQILLGNL